VPLRKIAAVHVQQRAVRGSGEHGRGVRPRVVVEQHLPENGPEAMPEEHEGQLGVFRVGDARQLANAGDHRLHPARTELAELREIAAVLLETGLPVAAQVARVDGVPGGDEVLGELLVLVPSRVLAEAMHDLHDGFRGSGPPDVVVDADALGILEGVVTTCGRELGHRAPSLAFIVEPRGISKQLAWLMS
jgi:hypothetical protein